MRFDSRIVLESVVHDAPIECAKRLQLHHITPTPDLLCGFFGLLHERVTRLRAVSTHINHHFGRRRILLEEDSVQQILQICQRLSLPADQSPGLLRLHIEEKTIVEMMFLDRGIEAERFKEFLERFFGLCWHIYLFLRPGTGALAAAAASSLARVSLVCAMVNKFCTVQ